MSRGRSHRGLTFSPQSAERECWAERDLEPSTLQVAQCDTAPGPTGLGTSLLQADTVTPKATLLRLRNRAQLSQDRACRSGHRQQRDPEGGQGCV